MDSQAQEYLSQYAPDGSSLYYACLYYPKATRQTILALHGFYTELKKIRSQIADPGVARIKLAWWQQELEKIPLGSSQHPLIMDLTNSISQHTIDLRLLNRMIEIEESMVQKSFSTEAHKISVYENTIGVVWQLCCEISNPLSSDETNWIKQAAATVQCLNDGFNFFADASNHQCELSTEFLNDKQFALEAVYHSEPDKIWQELIKPYIQMQQARLETLLMDNKAIPLKLFPQVLAQIYLARCKKALKKDLKTNNDILPIRKLFICWSIHRKLKSS